MMSTALRGGRRTNPKRRESGADERRAEGGEGPGEAGGRGSDAGETTEGATSQRATGKRRRRKGAGGRRERKTIRKNNIVKLGNRTSLMWKDASLLMAKT